MLLRAREEANRELACIPCGLKYLYTGDVSEALGNLAQELEHALKLPPADGLDLVDRVVRLGECALAEKEVAHLGEAQGGTLPERSHILEFFQRTDLNLNRSRTSLEDCLFTSEWVNAFTSFTSRLLHSGYFQQAR